MFGGGIFAIYKNYIDNLDLVASKIATPAISSTKILELEETSNDEDGANGQPVLNVNNLLDLKILNDPKFRSLKKSAAATIKIEMGKRNPFEL